MPAYWKEYMEHLAFRALQEYPFRTKTLLEKMRSPIHLCSTFVVGTVALLNS